MFDVHLLNASVESLADGDPSSDDVIGRHSSEVERLPEADLGEGARAHGGGGGLAVHLQEGQASRARHLQRVPRAQRQPVRGPEERNICISSIFILLETTGQPMAVCRCSCHGLRLYSLPSVG